MVLMSIYVCTCQSIWIIQNSDQVNERRKNLTHTHTVTRLEKKRGTKHRHIDSGMHIWSIHFSTNSIVHNTPVRCTYGSVLAYTLPNKFAYIWSLDDVKHVVSICQWPALNNDSNFCRYIYIYISLTDCNKMNNEPGTATTTTTPIETATTIAKKVRLFQLVGYQIAIRCWIVICA